MPIEQYISVSRGFDQWFKSTHGQRVAQFFSDILAHQSDYLHGSVCLQLGINALMPFNPLNYTQKWLANLYISKAVTFVSSFSTIPLIRNSVDCVIVPFGLEIFGQDKYLFDELDRVLKPMGHVIFLGINPLSFWGMWLKTKGPRIHGRALSLSSALSLKRAMSYRGYQQCLLSGFYFTPPVSHPRLIKNLAFLNQVGKMIWPFPAGFYCYIARKQQITMTPLRCRDKSGFFVSQNLTINV